MEVAVDGNTGSNDIFLADVEQLVRHFPAGTTLIRHSAVSKSRQSFGGAATTRSMSSAESIITRSLSLASCIDGIGFVETKYRSCASHCIFCSLAELSGLPSSVLELIFAEITMCTGDAGYYGFNNISSMFNHVGVSVRQKLGFEFSQGENKLARLIQQQEGLFAVMSDVHCVAVDCNRRLILNCDSDPAFDYALELSIESFEACGITATGNNRVSTVRRLVLNQKTIKFYHKANGTVLSALKNNLSKLKR